MDEIFVVFQQILLLSVVGVEKIAVDEFVLRHEFFHYDHLLAHSSQLSNRRQSATVLLVKGLVLRLNH